MKCPICRNKTEWKNNPFRPFCSERCKMIDLDHWLSERYRTVAHDESEENPAHAPASGPEEKIV
ncbi:MAG: DNA gyrase inhibitor YacG [Acidobacteria bacterium]|nr:DNA gyrase inhibitor YacG [Acidobacteriota bacterium]